MCKCVLKVVQKKISWQVSHYAPQHYFTEKLMQMVFPWPSKCVGERTQSAASEDLPLPAGYSLTGLSSERVKKYL